MADKVLDFLKQADWLFDGQEQNWKHVDTDNLVFLENPCHFETRGLKNMLIGRNSYSMNSGMLSPNVIIGRYCSISHFVNIGPTNHDMNSLGTGILEYGMPQSALNDEGDGKTTVIGCDVWIGVNATILSGVKIGHGAVVGAGAIVTKDVPPYAVVVGSPAKVVRYRFDGETRNELLALEWWKLDATTVSGLPKKDIQRCIKLLKSYRSLY